MLIGKNIVVKLVKILMTENIFDKAYLVEKLPMDQKSYLLSSIFFLICVILHYIAHILSEKELLSSTFVAFFFFLENSQSRLRYLF